jgi:hypothetical protein
VRSPSAYRCLRTVRNRCRRHAVCHLEMAQRASHPRAPRHGLPLPTPQFRLKAWHTFQRALDPFARPRPLKRPRP